MIKLFIKIYNTIIRFELTIKLISHLFKNENLIKVKISKDQLSLLYVCAELGIDYKFIKYFIDYMEWKGTNAKEAGEDIRNVILKLNDYEQSKNKPQNN